VLSTKPSLLICEGSSGAPLGHYSTALLSQTFPAQTPIPCRTHLLSTRPSLLCEWPLAVTAVLCPYYNPSLPFPSQYSFPAMSTITTHLLSTRPSLLICEGSSGAP
jgi:hypothetical protein